VNGEDMTPPYGWRRVAGERDPEARPGTPGKAETDKFAAQTPAGLGRDAKYCPLCPGWYRLSAITATAQDGAVTTADRVQLKVSSTPRVRVLGLRRKGNGSDTNSLSQAARADIVAKNYTLSCPRRHTLVNSAEPTIVVGVIGNVNSSKSHYLVGLVYELIYEQRLAALGADVGYIGDTGTVMDQRINSVYRDGAILNNTERGTVDGPFSYRLSRHLRTSAESKAVLTFFDVAGEDCVGLARSADFVRYLFNAAGIIVLVDPGGLPALGQPLRARGEASLTTRAIIDNLADAMEAVTGRPSHEQDQIICITIAKADAANLPAQVWPPEEDLLSTDEIAYDSKIRKRLREYSDGCRDALAKIGGRSLISAAESRFERSHIFYSAVSATNQSPLNGSWTGAQPVGCSIPLAQILNFSNDANLM
jgi:Double-GTPase 2